jgi:hypothetical protein
MTNASATDRAARARALLDAAYTELVAAAKVVVGDDARLLLTAASSVDLTVEALTPPGVDVALARGSCNEALGLAHQTRAYAQGGTIANALEPARKKIEDALALLTN